MRRGKGERNKRTLSPKEDAELRSERDEIVAEKEDYAIGTRGKGTARERSKDRRRKIERKRERKKERGESAKG